MKPLQEVPNLDNIIKSDRYVLKDFLGKGCWGKVYNAQDTLTDEEIAIKVLDPNEIAQQQMQERNIDPIKAMKKEALKLAACSNVVPRKLEIDENGKPFIVMPRYEKTLADMLNDNGERKFLNKGLSIDEVNKYIKDIAIGISETHNKLKRTHGDLKPDNIVLDEKGNALLTDFGSSTCASTGRSVSPRDNIGFVYTRAPENFKNGSHPEKQSDIWALDAIKFRLYTGKYPLEEEIDNSKDPTLFLEQVGDQGVNNIIRKKIKNYKKNIPRKARKPLKESLDVNPDKRPSSIDDAIKEFDKAIKPGFMVSHPYLATGVMLGTFSVLLGGGWLGKDLLSKDSTIKNLITTVEQAKKYTVGAEWNGGNLSIGNNLIELEANVSVKNRKSQRFPSQKALYANPGESLFMTITAKEVASNRDILYPCPPSLPGKAYILGYDAKDFGVFASSYDDTSQYDGPGYSGGFFSLQVPKDIPEGNHFLAIEVYSIKDPAKHDHLSVNHKSYNFEEYEKAISRMMIPLVIGDVKDNTNLDEINLGWLKSFVSFRDRSIDKYDYSKHNTLNQKLQYEICILEENKDFAFNGEGRTNSYFKHLHFKEPSSPGSKTMQIVIRDPSGKPISWNWMPVKYDIYIEGTEKNNYEDTYAWGLDFPGPDFNERIIKYRQELEQEEASNGSK